MTIPYRIVVKINDVGQVKVDVVKLAVNYILTCLS